MESAPTEATQAFINALLSDEVMAMLQKRGPKRPTDFSKAKWLSECCWQRRAISCQCAVIKRVIPVFGSAKRADVGITASGSKLQLKLMFKMS